MRSVVLAVIGVVWSGCRGPSAVDACTGADLCGPVGTCHASQTAPMDPARVSCTCNDGRVADPRVDPCAATFSKVTVNGVSVAVTGGVASPVVDLPAGTTALDVEAASAMPDTTVQIEGQQTNRLQVPWKPQLTAVTVAILARGQHQLDARILVRVGTHLGAVTAIAGGGLGVALSGDGKTLAGGSYSGERVDVLAEVDGGWRPVQTLAGSGFYGWTVALSANGEVLAASCGDPPFSQCTGPRLRVFRREPGGYLEEPLPSASGTPRIALSPEGRLLWAAQGPGGAVGYAKVDGGWERVADLGGPASSIAVSGDSQVVAVGSQDDGTLRLFGPADGGWVQTGLLRGDGGFGSSVALSADGEVLVVSARASHPFTAWVYERADGGYAPRFTVHPALDPNLELTSTLDFQLPVACSADGQTVAVGFPLDRSVVLARRTAAGWALRDVAVLHGDDQFGFFGNGVALSADGRRLAVSTPLAQQGLTLHDEAP